MRTIKARTVKTEFKVGYAIVTTKSIRPLKFEVSVFSRVKFKMYIKNKPVPQTIRNRNFLFVVRPIFLYTIVNRYIRNPYADSKNKSAKEGTGDTMSSTNS